MRWQVLCLPFFSYLPENLPLQSRCSRDLSISRLVGLLKGHTRGLKRLKLMNLSSFDLWVVKGHCRPHLLFLRHGQTHKTNPTPFFVIKMRHNSQLRTPIYLSKSLIIKLSAFFSSLHSSPYTLFHLEKKHL